MALYSFVHMPTVSKMFPTKCHNAELATLPTFDIIFWAIIYYFVTHC